MGERTRIKKAAGIALIAAAWLAIWLALAGLVGKSLLLPGPIDTFHALWRLMKTASFWRGIGATLARVAAGYLCAVATGALLAIGCAFLRGLDAFTAPLRAVIKATPVSSFIILVLLWLSNSVAPVFIAFLMVLPIIWAGTQQGLSSADRKLLEMAKVFGFSRMRTFRDIYIPSALPQFSSACATGLGFAWKAGIAAEVIAQPALSVGKNLQNAKVYLETPELFAWTIFIVLLSLILEKVLVRLIGRRMK